MTTKLPTIHGGDEFDPSAQHLLTDTADFIGRIAGPEIQRHVLRTSLAPDTGHIALSRGVPVQIQYSHN